MARQKIFVNVMTYPKASPNEFARAWVTRTIANQLDLKEKDDWVYISKDWMGVLSTQAMVEEILEEEGDIIYLSPDRMRDAHFNDNDKPKIWKLTEWE